jgi:hypothetical protein
VLTGTVLRNNAAAAGAAARLLRQARDDVPQALLGVGFVTCITAFRSAVSQPADSVLAYPVYLGALVVSLIGGLNTMWAAGWVAEDPARRRAAGRIILCASLVPMVIAVGLSNDHDVFFDILRAVT